MMKRSGHRQGERHHHAKLTEAAVRDIRSNYLAYVPGRGIGAFAKKYGVSDSTIRDVLSFKSWASAITEQPPPPMALVPLGSPHRSPRAAGGGL